MNYFRLVILAVLMLGTVLLAFVYRPSASSSPSQPTAVINGHIFTLTIAKTPQQQIDGLSGWTDLGPSHGMYFPLNNRQSSFWMKDMLIDIDIIWIDNGQVVEIDHRVPAPGPGTPDTELPSYPSPVTRPDGVLEIAAGRSTALGMAVGDPVTLHLD